MLKSIPCNSQYHFLVCNENQTCGRFVIEFEEHRLNGPLTPVSTNEVQNFFTKSAENGQNLSARKISAKIVESEESSASVDVIRKDLRSHREKGTPLGRPLESVILQQTFDIETSGSSYIIYVIEELPQNTYRNCSEEIGVVIFLSCSSLLDKIVDSLRFGVIGQLVFFSSFLTTSSLNWCLLWRRIRFPGLSLKLFECY